jgi:hypothetical protein
VVSAVRFCPSPSHSQAVCGSLRGAASLSGQRLGQHTADPRLLDDAITEAIAQHVFWVGFPPDMEPAYLAEAP